MTGVVGALLVGYVVGSIPFAWLVARLWGGIDIRRHGSGNPGATNVARVLGKGPGLVALALDVAKGWWPVVHVLGEASDAGATGARAEAAAVAAAVGAVLGHMWPVFLKFRGGKGVATGAGAFLALAPVETAWAAAAFAAVFAPTGVVSASSIAAAIALTAAAFVRRDLMATPTALAAAALSAVVVARHRENIRRLLDGTERPLGRSGTAPPPPSPYAWRVLLAYLVVAAAVASWALLR